MSHTALQLAGADLEHTAGTNLASDETLNKIESEAAALAALAGAFGLFGLKLAVETAQAWPERADDAYRADETPPAPANEVSVEFTEITEVETVDLIASEPVEIQPTAFEPANDVEPLENVETLVATELLDAADAEAPVAVEAAPISESRALITLQNFPLADPAARSPFPILKPRNLRFSPGMAMRLMQGIDWLVILAAAQFAALWGNGLGLAALTLNQAITFIAAAGALKVGLWLTDLYRTAPGKLRAEHGAGGLALGVVAGLLIAAFAAPDARSAAALSATLPLAALLLAGAHAAFALWLGALHRAGAFSETVVIVGATDAAERLVRRAAERGDARVVAVVDDRLARSPHKVANTPVVGTIDDLLAWESLPHVDRIVITVTQKAEGRVRGLIEKLRVVPNRIDLLLDYETWSVRGARRIDRLTGAAMACVSGRPHNFGRALLKRAQDLILGVGLLVAFAPVMAVIAAAVKLDSKGPVLYRQRRHGFNNRIITVLKFRTMRHDPNAPLRQVVSNDPRITRIGAFLRRSSLDELPQLINVLRGDMSLVGPRPHAVGMRTADRDLSHIVAEYAHRHQVKPGMSGWAQVNGSRGPLHTPASVRERVKYDLDYVSNASLWFDLIILLRTVPSLFGDRKATR